MKLAFLMTGLGISSCLVVTTANHASAQSPPVKALVYIGTIAVTTYMGIRAADATKKLELQGGSISSPSPQSPPPSPQSPLRGTVYKLGPEWKTITSAGYCVSYIPEACSPCDWDGTFCGGHYGEGILRIQSDTIVR
jgi:hypothetical protein